jgi:hypothetical protein
VTAAASIPWVAFENAIFSWIVGGSGLPAKRVEWDHQRQPRPDSNTTPFIAMMITELQPFGYDWLDIADNPSPSPGQEIIKFARGQRTCELTLEIYGSKNTLPDGSVAGAIGNTIAADIMASKLFYLTAFNAIGVGILGFGPSRGSPQRVPIALDPRVILTITFSLGSELQMPDTYIEFVNITSLDPSWAPDTLYQRGNNVTNGGIVYQCIATGTSAGSGGPTGRGSGIVDGGTVWNYVADGQGSPIWVPYDPTP